MSLQSYETRINRVTAFIYDHLDEPLDLDRLADVAALSPWHWHRVYSAMRGETIADTVRRLRLMRAAADLANTEHSVEEVARRSGYDNVQSFTRIFAEAYGMPPATYRREGTHAAYKPGGEGGGAASASDFEVKIVTLDPIRVAVEEHKGSYMNIGAAFERLFIRLGSLGLLGPKTRMIGIYSDDPDAKPEADLDSQAALTVDGPVPETVRVTTLPGGDYAVLRHKGPYADMRAAYRWFFGTWLPQSDREPADRPVLEEYLNSPRDTPPGELLTDLYLPLR